MSLHAGRVALLALACALLAATVALLGVALNRPLLPGGDARLGTGDCVVLTSTSVRPASCATAHDGRVTTVLRGSYQLCPPGSDEVDLPDSPASFCVDPRDGAH